MRRLVQALLLLAACGDVAAAPQDAPPAKPPAAATKRPWIDPTGDSIVGFGLLRVVPPKGGGGFRVHYTEKPTEYSSGDQYQLFVLPGDAFAEKESAHAGDFLAFTRTDPAKTDGYGDLTVEFRVKDETTVIVAYGPWTAPDAGRPPGDTPTFTLDVTPVESGGAFEWVESEMGELITTNWTNRPEVARGAPFRDQGLYVEVRPMILYDGRSVRASDEPPPKSKILVAFDHPDNLYDPNAGDFAEECDDSIACDARFDRRVTMNRSLAEKFRRVPIRWR